VEELTLGVIATSRKEHELRLPIHPRHFDEIDAGLRGRMVLEEGYGERFQVTDDELRALGARLAPRREVIAETDIVLLPKPMAEDLGEMREGQVLCGWVHAVQDSEVTQLAIDRRLTAITWESMNFWSDDGGFRLHLFHANNELAGYCSVLHAMELRGMTGEYGRRLRAAVIGFGATGRGAVNGLNAMGIPEISGLTRRPAAAVADPIPGVELVTYDRDPDHPSQPLELDAPHASVAALLAEHDVVVNCVLQDPDRPLILVRNEEVTDFLPGTLFVDVSCDEGMGFEWARPTTFSDPVFEVAGGRFNYGVDHSPSLLWEAATWEISRALLPLLAPLMDGAEGWTQDQTISKAIEIRDGRVLNPKIFSFQGRDPEFPHPRNEQDPKEA
jgi:alanine dehydrogenase